MWQEYGDQWGPNPRRRKIAKGHSISTHISTEMDQEENERHIRKNCGICRQQSHNRNNCFNMSSSLVFPYTSVIV